MGDEIATANVNRSYSLAATSIAIFTFMLIFLYPKFASGQINALLFQATLLVMAGATLMLFLHLCALYYAIARWLFLRDAGRKLSHLDRQLGTPEGVHEELRTHLGSWQR